jgi:hypothetical protein
VSVLFLFRYYFGYDESSWWSYANALCLLVAPWIYHPIKSRENGDEFIGTAGEELMKEWELEYIVRKQMAEKRQDG